MFGSRGRVGNVVGYQREGKKLMRSLPTSVKNPRTVDQTITRLAFSTASKMAQHLRGIVDHSFQGVKYGQTSVNHFTSLLSKELRTFLAGVNASSPSVAPFGTAPVLPLSASGIGCAARALVSKGDLKGMPYELSDDASDGRLYIGNAILNMSNALTVTLADYESVFGVPMTDQVTIIEGHPEELDYISEEELFFGVRFDWLRWNIKQDTPLTTTIFVEGDVSGECKLNSAILDMERTDPRVLNVLFEVKSNTPDQLAMYSGSAASPKDIFGHVAAADVSHAAVIVSRFENNAWRRSTSRLVLTQRRITQSAVSYEEEYGYNDVASVIALAAPTKDAAENEYLNKKKGTGVA